MTTRAEHLVWCKARAFEFVRRGDLIGAIYSMEADLEKHPETKIPPSHSLLTLIGAMAAKDGNVSAVKRWIEAFD